MQQPCCIQHTSYAMAFYIILPYATHIISSHPTICYHLVQHNKVSSHLILSIPYHAISHYITSHHTTPHHFISHPIPSYHILSQHILSYHVICPIIGYYHVRSARSRRPCATFDAPCIIRFAWEGVSSEVCANSPLTYITDNN